MDSKGITHYQIFTLAKKLEEKGLDVIHLEVGDPYVEVDDEINNELCRRANMGYTHYSSPYGIDELREAASKYLTVTLGVEAEKERILITPGSKSGLKMFLDIISKEVDTAVTFDPTWSAYEGLLEYHGIELKTLKTMYENRWRPTEDDLTELENMDFQLMILLNPSNPTGLKMESKLVDKLVEIAMNKNAIIVSDEVYYQTIYRDENVKNYPTILRYEYEYTVALHSLSKSHAMTGYRLGWVVTKEEWIEKMRRLVQYSYTNVPVFIQYAGIKALENLSIPNRLRKIYRERALYMAERLEKLGFRFHRPDSTFYIFASTPEYVEDTSTFILRLLEEKNVAVAPGTSFGGYEEFIRFSASYPEDRISEGMDRIEELLNNWST